MFYWVSWELTKLISQGKQTEFFSLFFSPSQGWRIDREKKGDSILAGVIRLDMFPCDAYWKLQLLGWTSGLSLSNLTGFICTMSAGGRVEIPFSSYSNMSLLFIKVLARRQHSFFIPVDCSFLINLTSLLYHRTVFTILELIC